MVKSLVILAAGLGSRYGGLKQLDVVGPTGEALLDYAIHDAERAGIEHVVVVVRRDIEELVRSHVDARWASRIPVEYALQDLADLPEGFELPPNRQRPWGTGHAVLAARSLVDAPFIAVNADDFYGATSYSALQAHSSPRGDATHALMGFRLDATLTPSGGVSRGICTVSPGGMLTGVTEAHDLVRREQLIEGRIDDRTETFAADTTVSMNMWSFGASIFSVLQEEFKQHLHRAGDDPHSEFLLPEAVTRMIAAGRIAVQALKSTEQWFGVTHPRDIDVVREKVRELIRRGRYPRSLDSR